MISHRLVLDDVVNQRNMPVLGKKHLPILIEASVGMDDLLENFYVLKQTIDALLPRYGAVLIRGYQVPDVKSFQTFAAMFGHPLLNYDFASTPRHALEQGVYTSTEYPAHQSIPLHNEQSYTLDWPMKIWFHCVIAAASGGETPIADSRYIYELMPKEVLDVFANKGLCYIRNYGNGLDLPWQKVFNTSDKAVVEAFCQKNAIEWEWKADGELRTKQKVQAVAVHPITNENVWFNQAHLFHASALSDELREVILETVGQDNLPRHVVFGDGSEIPDEMLQVVRSVLDEAKIVFSWQQGDVLMLDNMLFAHAREPFSGPRKIVVAMAEGYQEKIKNSLQHERCL